MRSRKRGCLGISLTLVLAVMGTLRWIARPASPQAWFDDAPAFLVLAHQGGEGEWPSNTMEAFRRSQALGVDGLDLDVHLSQDGVLVLMHDTTVDRTTDGRGSIRDMSWAQLQKLDAGYRFTQDGSTFPYRGKGLKVPRLEQVLEAFPGQRLGIEIKQAPLEAASVMGQLLKNSGAESRVLLSSFDEGMMKEIRRCCPEVATSATPWEAKTFVAASRLYLEDWISPAYCSLQIPLQYKGMALLSERTVEAAHRRGLKVLPWTIDTLEDAEFCRKVGADGLNTNWPSRMVNP